MTKRLLPLIVLLIGWLLFACQPSSPSDTEHLQVTKEKQASKPKTKEEITGTFVWLTDEKAPKFLTDYGKKHPETDLKITTDFGEIVIRLYTETTIHRANMLYLVQEKNYFNATQFYRIAKDFVVQGGDADSEYIQDRRFAIGKYELPAEFRDGLYHKRGAVGMTRHYQNNPKKMSNPFDFYIVTGKKYSDNGLNAIEREHKTKFTDAQRTLYKTIGGAPHLDNEHTVIGEVIQGFDVVLKMNQVEVDKSEWPLDPISMQVEVLQ